MADDAACLTERPSRPTVDAVEIGLDLPDEDQPGYDDLKTIEAYQFLKSIREGQQSDPGFREALVVAEVQDAIQRSWETEAWEDVRAI